MASVNNIERLREARGWKRPELAKRMNTTPQTIERLEKGHRSLRPVWIDRAALAFGVEPAEIISPMITVPEQDSDATRLVDQGEVAPISLLDLSFSMGPGTDIDHYVEETPFSFDLGYIRSFTRTPPSKLRLAHGVGESMYPTLLSNDLVWIDTTQTDLNQQDRLWAISLFGAAAIKRLRMVGPGRVLVISDNPAVQDQEVDAADVIVTGRVIRIARDL